LISINKIKKKRGKSDLREWELAREKKRGKKKKRKEEKIKEGEDS
jgi:hypothetical protein